MTDIDELKKEIEQEENIFEDTEDSIEEECTRYDITSYGIDFDVDGLVRRVKRGDIFIPSFQRDYVWKLPEASRFVESLLLGLPVPGVFLAQDPESGKMLVIDGQQRLLTLKYFFEGYFKPSESAKSNRIFRLAKVKEAYDGKTFEELESKDRINLENAVIHATIVKQESPAEDDTSIYHIFERLNSGGRKLTAQEIRVAVYHGRLMEFAKEINESESWRAVFGPKNDRMKDVELILRFWAMNESFSNYSRPMVDFINGFCNKNRNPTEEKLELFKNQFLTAIDAFHSSIQEKLFRPTRALNVALFESCMVGLSARLAESKIDQEEIESSYHELIENPEFEELISQSTADVKNVKRRMEIAIAIFSGN